MPIQDIKELRILPPLAIARFGSSPEPLENYEARIGEPAGFRRLQPAPTLIVDDATGAIARETAPDPDGKVAFRDTQRRIKPLAPFLELWARFEDGGGFEPLSKDHLAELGLDPAALHWNVHVANIKAFRRTGHPADKVEARVQIKFDSGQPDALHSARDLRGGSTNFKIGKAISFGSVRYIRPTDAFPEIRFRFTPAAGRVFGPRAGDPLVVDDVYAGVTSTPAAPNGNWSWPFAGVWDRYWIGAPNSPPVTAPGDIFQGQDVGDTKVSDGYLDDTCDGIVEVLLTRGETTLSAYARIMSGVPDFAPDGYHIRTIADDLEQMAFGPEVAAPGSAADRQRIKRDVEDILRRAFETVRMMNPMVQNGDQGVGGVTRNRNNMAGHQSGYGRVFEPFYPAGTANYALVVAIHRALLQQALAAADLEGTFFHLGRMRRYDEIGDLRTPQRRRMPAMMRGSDGLEATLTRRQMAKLNLGMPPGAPFAALAAAAPVEPAGASLRRLPPIARHSLPNE